MSQVFEIKFYRQLVMAFLGCQVRESRLWTFGSWPLPLDQRRARPVREVWALVFVQIEIVGKV